jgi:hypothetical protein
MATPGMTFDFSCLVAPTIPANPPKIAMRTSHTVGVVRANNSDCASCNGDIEKYRVETIRLIAVAMPRFDMARFTKSKS